MSLRAVKIAEVRQHPQASRLKICLVHDGGKKIQVICGAKNVKCGMHTIYAPVGCKIPGGVEIKKADFRGYPSEGMLCSAKDLGMAQESGIVQLPHSIDPGTLLSKIPREYLSSVPWYSFNKVESFWQSLDHKIYIERKNDSVDYEKKKFKLLSRTYFDGESYLYRDFGMREDT